MEHSDAIEMIFWKCWEAFENNVERAIWQYLKKWNNVSKTSILTVFETNGTAENSFGK